MTRSRMVPNQERKDAVVQVPYCFWPKSFDYGAEWAGALSWWSFQFFPVHMSGRFLRTASQRPRKVVLFIDCLTFWHVFVMHYAAGIEETGQHHFHVTVNMSWFFGPWWFRMLSLWRLILGFWITTINPGLITSYDSLRKSPVMIDFVNHQLW